MIFYFHYTRVCRGVIYHIMPNFICYSREKRVKVFRSFLCIIYDFIVFTKDSFLFTRVTFFFRKERFNSCLKITSFGTSGAAFQKNIFHGFLFQFSNQMSLLSKFLPCFSIALLGTCILGIQHMFTAYGTTV